MKVKKKDAPTKAQAQETGCKITITRAHNNEIVNTQSELSITQLAKSVYFQLKGLRFESPHPM